MQEERLICKLLKKMKFKRKKIQGESMVFAYI